MSTDHTTRPDIDCTVFDWLPVTIRNREGRVYEDFTVCGYRIIAPLATDFASIPRILTWLFPRTGWWLAPSIGHDDRYKRPGVSSRAEIDRWFYEALKVFRDQSDGEIGLFTMPADDKPAPIRREINHWLNMPVPCIFYLGVRLGGWVAWNGHRKSEGKPE